MKWLALIAVLAACAAPVAAAPNTSTAACGDMRSRLIYTIKSQRVACTLARRIAIQWGSECALLRTGSCLVTALYYCRYRDTGSGTGSVKCIHDADLCKPLSVQRVVSFVTRT